VEGEVTLANSAAEKWDTVQEFVAILTPMDDILRRYGLSGQADVVAKAISLALAGDPEFRILLGSVDFWGGAGAVWEVYLDERFSDREQQKADEREFHGAIVRLADKMKTLRWDSPRVRQVAGLCKDWNPFNRE
jgi:hypothetical protein